jgi:rod shape determining protein RodA
VLSPGLVTFASLFGVQYLAIAMILVVAALFFFKRDLFNSATVFIINLGASFFFDYAYRFLKPHQQKRIDSFLNPAADPPWLWLNALQAKLAIGSGGLFGKGFMQGNQTHNYVLFPNNGRTLFIVLSVRNSDSSEVFL